MFEECCKFHVSVFSETHVIPTTSSPRTTFAHLRVNKYSHWTKCFLLLFFFFENLIKIEDAGDWPQH